MRRSTLWFLPLLLAACEQSPSVPPAGQLPVRRLADGVEFNVKGDIMQFRGNPTVSEVYHNGELKLRFDRTGSVTRVMLYDHGAVVAEKVISKDGKLVGTLDDGGIGAGDPSGPGYGACVAAWTGFGLLLARLQILLSSPDPVSKFEAASTASAAAGAVGALTSVCPSMSDTWRSFLDMERSYLTSLAAYLLLASWNLYDGFIP